MKDLPRGLSAAGADDTPPRPRAAGGVWLLLAALMVCVLLAWAIAIRFSPLGDAGHKPAAPMFTAWNFNPFATGDPTQAARANADAALAADAARLRVQRVWETGSLRGSDLDGDWGRWVNQVLQPSTSLRRRFDYLLTALGEVDHHELRHWIEQQVTIDINLAAARQVLAVWDRYIALQQHSFASSLNPNDARSWQPALAERSAVRKQMLGDAWAKAFYGDEEQAFVAFAERRAASATAASTQADAASAALLLTPSTQAMTTDQLEQLQARRTQQFGSEAAERLRVEDAAWADWERRVAEARVRLLATEKAPELSALQRTQAQEAYLAAHFSGSELVRARAVLRNAP